MDARLPKFTASSDRAESGQSQQKADRTIAEQVDALSVYEDAVQEPLLECTNLASMYYQAQPIGSYRPDAKILREDFCSSAIVAQTWLSLGKDHRAQGVDIDLKALQVAQKRLMETERAERTACIVQSDAYSDSGSSRKLPYIKANRIQTDSIASQEASGSRSSSPSTWAEGAASDRFERKFQARLAKERAKAARKSGTLTPSAQEGDQTIEDDVPTAKGDVLILQHADVLSLPIKGLEGVDVESPDLIYAGNYALSYFHDRRSLLAYLAQCRRTLRKKTGVLIVDPFAGPTSWEAKTDAERKEQEELWNRFSKEPGFLRAGEEHPPSPLKGDPLEFWAREEGEQKSSSDTADWRQWPRGRLILVRKGHVGGEYEYWREDGPLDYTTNRFRMSLSFRFTRDGSWLRDYFSYDFRVWSLREITEAMEEVGFERVAVHAIPRTTESDQGEAMEKEEAEMKKSSDSDMDESGDDNDGLNGMAGLMERTEKNEAGKSTYKVVEPHHKLFATRSFGSEYSSSLS
ncbi:uncharacterized protein FA14DRAFT_126935 [Meira miltonrushii]|uniref:Uncharacterized protein n=1 Tax=Meira miltonrushii TaxID=1280837 RepID=A0A316V753_9BASI|nr:uncharacterized protein FA14DRAFT_126935 [Meira miltonrushii]PWN32331.1 hypothetical protein FA14DRAFT_126935 [Meira miltonrushii]